MARVDDETIARLARLGRLDVTELEEELAALERAAAAMRGMIDELRRHDAHDHPLEGVQEAAARILKRFPGLTTSPGRTASPAAASDTPAPTTDELVAEAAAGGTVLRIEQTPEPPRPGEPPAPADPSSQDEPAPAAAAELELDARWNPGSIAGRARAALTAVRGEWRSVSQLAELLNEKPTAVGAACKHGAHAGILEWNERKAAASRYRVPPPPGPPTDDPTTRTPPPPAPARRPAALEGTVPVDTPPVDELEATRIARRLARQAGAPSGNLDNGHVSTLPGRVLEALGWKDDTLKGVASRLGLTTRDELEELAHVTADLVRTGELVRNTDTGRTFYRRAA